MDLADDARFRVRRWGPGGKAAGSASFRVSKTTHGVEPQAVPVRPSDSALLKRLTAMEGAMDVLRARVGQLETRLEAAKDAIERMLPTVDAAERALSIFADSDDDE